MLFLECRIKLKENMHSIVWRANICCWCARHGKSINVVHYMIKRRKTTAKYIINWTYFRVAKWSIVMYWKLIYFQKGIRYKGNRDGIMVNISYFFNMYLGSNIWIQFCKVYSKQLLQLQIVPRKVSNSLHSVLHIILLIK